MTGTSTAWGPPARCARKFCGSVRPGGSPGPSWTLKTGSPPLEQITGQLNEQFARRGWTLYVAEGYGSCAPQGRVMIPSALSGGSLQRRLEEALERFGESRVALALEKRREDFFLPSPTGSGQPLTQQELEELKRRLSPSVFFSGDLCARYFTYMSRDNGAHFVLFDDGDTLRRKVEVGRKLGIHTFLAPWAEVASCAAQLGIPKKPEQRQVRSNVNRS